MSAPVPICVRLSPKDGSVKGAEGDQKASRARSPGPPPKSPRQKETLSSTAAGAGGRTLSPRPLTIEGARRSSTKPGDESLGSVKDEFDSKFGGKLILQRIDEGSICVDEQDSWETCGKGYVAYVCFLKSASPSTVEYMVNTIMNCKNLEDDELEGKESVACVKTDVSILLVPQAPLAAKLKNNSLQFHSLVDKKTGLSLYKELVDQLRQQAEALGGSQRTIKVVAGTYGNRQALRVRSNGPHTLCFDI